MPQRITIQLENTNVNPDNYQLIDFTSNTVSNSQQHLAEVLAYIAKIGGHFADGTQVVAAWTRVAGSAGAVELDFPSTDYAAIRTAVGGGVIPAWAAYGAIPGASGVLTPLGTSVSVSLFTATPGRAGRGRHFLGFLGAQCVSAGGQFASVNINETIDAYDTFIMSPTAGPAFAPIVSNSAMSTAHPVTLVRPQPILSNLESRRR